MPEAAKHHDPLSPSHLFEHVQDSTYIQVPAFLAPPDGRISLTGEKTEEVVNVEGYHFRLPKFMVIEGVAALLIAVVFIRLASRMRRSDVPKGRWWNLLEMMLVYIRD